MYEVASWGEKLVQLFVSLHCGGICNVDTTSLITILKAYPRLGVWMSLGSGCCEVPSNTRSDIRHLTFVFARLLFSRGPHLVEAPVLERQLFSRGPCFLETPVLSMPLFCRCPCFVEAPVSSRSMLFRGPCFGEAPVFSRSMFGRGSCLGEALSGRGTRLAQVSLAAARTLIRPCVHRRFFVFVPCPEKDRRPIYNWRVWCCVTFGLLYYCNKNITRTLGQFCFPE